MKKVLASLVTLQDVDTQLRDIEISKGDLPREVTELNNQIVALEKDINDMGIESEDLKQKIKETEKILVAAQASLKKYQTQLYDVKTNKEYDAITMEIESATNEINSSETMLLEFEDKIDSENEKLTETKNEYGKLQKELAEKEKELTELIKKSEEKERILEHEREKIVMVLKSSLLKKYERIRNAKNGLAVARVERGACGGCKRIIPPQKIVEINKLDELITCEICGRVLVPDNYKNNSEN
ncbi:zinc ribbon domain-containing protein [candidate division KSB1 bacterium]